MIRALWVLLKVPHVIVLVLVWQNHAFRANHEISLGFKHVEVTTSVFQTAWFHTKTIAGEENRSPQKEVTDAGLMCPRPMCPRPKVLGCGAP